MKRRDFLKDAACAAGAVVAGRCAADGESARRGRVTGGGNPLKGVVVTDGLACAVTDAKGEWSLPYRAAARFVSVTVPSGWRIPRHYIPLAGTDDGLDFALEPWAASAEKGCRFLHVADSEIHDTKEAGCRWIGSVKEIAAEIGAAFVVHTGDICARSGLIAHIQVMNENTVGTPVFWCIGNHDLVPGGKYGEELFESLYGPCWYSFEAGGVHFCVTPMPRGDAPPSYTHDDVAAWMRNDLALIPKGMPVIVFNHFLTHAGDVEKSGRMIGVKDVFDIGAACNLSGFVYGHCHHNFFRRRDGMTLICTANPQMGGIDHSPATIREISVGETGRITSKLHHWPVRRWKPSRADAEWETRLPGGVLFCNPEHADGRIFVATADDAAGAGTVNSIDAATGAIVWSRQTANSVNGRIAVARGKVFAMDVEGNVHAFAAKDGAAVWRKILPRTPNPWDPFKGGVVFDPDADLVFAGSGGKRLAAFDADTGSQRWCGVTWKRETEPCATVPAVGGGVLVASAQWSGLHGQESATGQHLWFRDGITFFHLGPRPLIVGDKVYALCRWAFYELDLRTGETLREVKLPGSAETATGILLTDRLFIFGTIRDGMIALDRATLEIVWRMDVGEALMVNAPYCRAPVKAISSEPVRVSEGLGALAANDGAVHVFRLEDGKEVRRIDTGAPYLSSPCIAGGRLYAADCAGFVRSFKL